MQDSNKIVYLVRHGESEGNAAGIFQGETPPLSALGHTQAQEIAGRAVNIDFDTLISSNFPRARQTAEYIQKSTGKPHEIFADVGEMREPSSIVGKVHQDPEALAIWSKWVESYSTGGAPVEDGETFEGVMKRADTVLEHFMNHESKTLLVVTHGFFLRAIIARVLLGEHLTPQSFMYSVMHSTTTNTGLSLLSYGKLLVGEGWKIRVYNDHAHLG